MYLKNLHSSVTAADLEAVFGALRPADVPADSWAPPHIRLMKGRLRGQAFVAFSCKFSLLCLSFSIIAILSFERLKPGKRQPGSLVGVWLNYTTKPKIKIAMTNLGAQGTNLVWADA